MFKDLVKSSRSHRGFDESYRLTREELKELVDYARYAPAAMNKQPLKFALVAEPDKAELILSFIRMGAALPELHLPAEGEHPTAFIVICHDESIAKQNNFFIMDVGIEAQTIMLAAAERGLGGCMVGAFDKAGVREALGLSDNLSPELILALGKPLEKVKIVEVGPDESIKYYRDGEGTHIVPKRRLSDIIIN